MQNCTCGAKQLVDVTTATTSWKLVGRVRLEANLQNLARTIRKHAQTNRQDACATYCTTSTMTNWTSPTWGPRMRSGLALLSFALVSNNNFCSWKSFRFST